MLCFYSTVMQSSHWRLPSKAAACFNFAISLQVKINLELFKQTKWAVCNQWKSQKRELPPSTRLTRHPPQRHPPVCSSLVTNTVTGVPCPHSAPPSAPHQAINPTPAPPGNAECHNVIYSLFSKSSQKKCLKHQLLQI